MWGVTLTGSRLGTHSLLWAFLPGAWSPVCGTGQCSLQSAAKSVVRCLEFMALFVEHHGVLIVSVP